MKTTSGLDLIQLCKLTDNFIEYSAGKLFGNAVYFGRISHKGKDKTVCGSPAETVGLFND